MYSINEEVTVQNLSKGYLEVLLLTCEIIYESKALILGSMYTELFVALSIVEKDSDCPVWVCGTLTPRSILPGHLSTIIYIKVVVTVRKSEIVKVRFVFLI